MTVQIRHKILVVDDSLSIGQVLKSGLGKHGFDVRYETRSTDALTVCLDFRPDLILLDLDMPIKDGGQVASELQSHPTLRHIPVIFLTSLISKEESAKRNASGELLLSKPICIAELAARIIAVLQPVPAPRDNEAHAFQEHSVS
jgi:DNA-binding response OmpR family regulator